MKIFRIVLNILLCFTFILTTGFISFDGDSVDPAEAFDYMVSNITFLPNNNILQNTSINGLTIILNSPAIGYLDIPYDVYLNKNIYDNIYKFNYNHYGVTIVGVNLSFINNTDKLIIIKSNQSNIKIENYSGIPFVSGMKYENAGNPSATPDILVLPHQTISKGIMISRCQFDKFGWQINGIFLPKSNNLKVYLYLKIENEDGSSQYISVDTPPIGMIK